MKQEVLVIGRSFHPDGKETAALIADALVPFMAEHSMSVRFVALKDLLFDISNQTVRVLDMASGRDIAEAAVVLLTNWFSHASIRKDMAYSLAIYLEDCGVPFYNSEALHSRSTSKLSQMMLAAKQNVPVARTVFSLSLQHLRQYLEQNEFAVPFIFKDAQASRGRGNYMLQSIDDIAKHSSEHSEAHPFIAQTLVKSDGSDYRFFVAGGKTRLIIHRTGNAGSHLNNTSAGAVTKIVPLEQMPSHVHTIVETMSKILHREVTGIDIMLESASGAPVFLEANPIPQIATGSNVEYKLRALAGALAEAAQSSESNKEKPA